MLGYPGAGKTTTSKAIEELTGAVHLWADHIRREMFGHPNPDYSADENAKVYHHLNELAAQLLREGKSVIYDTNFNYYDDRQKMRQIAQAANARTVLVWVQTDRSLAKMRATQNAHLQSHRVIGNMPEATFERMAGNLREPLADEEYIVIDGSRVTPEYVSERLGAASRP